MLSGDIFYSYQILILRHILAITVLCPLWTINDIYCLLSWYKLATFIAILMEQISNVTVTVFLG